MDNGTYNSVKSQLHTAMYQILADNNNNNNNTSNKPQLSNINLIINTLINEYLQYNSYHNTAKLLQYESNGSADNNNVLSHELLASQLNIIDSNSNVPLLYSIISLLQQNNNKK